MRLVSPATIEICVHCYRYSRLLSMQLASLAAYSPDPAKASVTITVWHTMNEPGQATAIALGNLDDTLADAGIRLLPRDLPRERLLRRAIGRNITAKETAADFVWFADCDYLFGPGCLDALPAAAGAATGALAFPQFVMETATEQEGDRRIAEWTADPAPLADRFDNFYSSLRRVRFNRAIGGIQIVRGEVARKYGYLPGHAIHQSPASEWKRTYDDVAYRKSLAAAGECGPRGSRGEPILLPNLVRITHTKKGRQGAVDL